MKKIIFTLFALVAFSGLSMAASPAKTFKIKAVKLQHFKRTACDAGWIQEYENNGGGRGGIQAADAWASSHNC